MDDDRPAWIPIDRRVVALWRGLGFAAAAAVVAVVAGLEVLLRQSGRLEGLPVAGGPLLVAVVAGGAAAVGPALAHRRWRYRLADDALELRRGVVVRRSSAIPYLRVQQVDLVQGPAERVLGLHRAVVSTAAATTDGSIPGLDAATADRVRRLILERVGDDDAV